MHIKKKALPQPIFFGTDDRDIHMPQSPAVSIVMPTYNEAANLPELVKGIHSRLAGIGHEVVIVDDDSPDGTGRVAEELNAIYGNVKVIIRKENRGYGLSYLRGLAESKGDVVVTMDADCSHPVEIIPDLLRDARENDVSVASRWVRGGGTESPAGRVALSSFTSFFFRFFFRVRVKDITSGYRAYRRKAVEDIIRMPIRSEGFEVLTEILVRLSNKGYKIHEIPFRYLDRHSGESKMKTSYLLKRYVRLILNLLMY
ncbi:MAG TPA: polyprenol monophosphomannose synthase [Candidatus Methanoperedenaceae archaeon]|nr:polyprenol monophosphomannose synthase [Candidatus Methanoperedenaceae archaeon]